ncbi:lytic murein transglycosylase B [Candidatus Methylospira mobilis]|uniref:Lytic murein transglycosylase B n=1 Tax=Candidatus Methylospira mobilis TaxID=1808979 RepID=A0A5Q0BG39_9GAMM|nr:lytic murein transglycosylase B [Candidatus Methylospira mobilis]QFY42092.1 lytic murein transglycosylase B [Candidatus Methylospira mobilis]
MKRHNKIVICLGLAGSLSLPACAGRQKTEHPAQQQTLSKPPISEQDTAPPYSSNNSDRPEKSYRATRLSGDFQGYSAVDDFIARLSEHHGYSKEYLYGVLSQAKRKQWTLDYLARETPSSPNAKPRPGAWSRYRSQFLDEQHIAGGTKFWRQHADDLHRASEQYGVPPEYIVGIIGVETSYGKNVGSHRIVDALTTLAFDYPRRGAYFAEELENFFVMTTQEKMDPLKPVGSYAGAMGLGQFMPGSFLKWAMDLNGDGKKDLWSPADAIGSVANYFSSHGWQRGGRVVTPATAVNSNAGALEAGYDTHYSLDTLRDNGIQVADNTLPDQNNYKLLRLSTNSGDEYRIGHDNFYVITRYNHSTHYAMAVHELAQAIKARMR